MTRMLSKMRVCSGGCVEWAKCDIFPDHVVGSGACQDCDFFLWLDLQNGLVGCDAPGDDDRFIIADSSGRKNHIPTVDLTGERRFLVGPMSINIKPKGPKITLVFEDDKAIFDFYEQILAAAKTSRPSERVELEINGDVSFGGNADE